jgi:hypothetical protein
MSNGSKFLHLFYLAHPNNCYVIASFAELAARPSLPARQIEDWEAGGPTLAALADDIDHLAGPAKAAAAWFLVSRKRVQR